MKGKAWNYGDDVNTDFILPGIYLELTDPDEMGRHAMEGIDPGFASKVRPGDVVVGGRNFGLGSSREHAPIALKHSGVGAVVAEGFARIFYRNAANLGLPALECPDVSREIKTGDTVEVDLTEGVITVNGSKQLRFKPVPEFMMEIIEVGGLREYIKKNRDKW
ncbi:3-isopropylmalate dehydratase small subunit [Candidatus Bathyarchaeota archaeon]|nr:3-isopropylmalate dehydratase small subunit [Candidatus Bathyarchaeota archaeon]MCK4703278.1 3-isopropylmalate dehydratase small subunit [Candidatus Bathyarchaeota archaeon]